MKQFISLFYAVLLSAVFLFTVSAVNLTDAEIINELPMELQNGSFETPNIWATFREAFTYHTQTPLYHTVAQMEGTTNTFHWRTTAQNDLVATWLTSYTDRYKAAKAGEYFMEINAKERGTLYQSIKTVPGSELRWGVSHAAHAANCYDVMALVIGPAQMEDTIKKNSPEEADVFAQMLNWYRAASGQNGVSFDHSSSATQAVIYSADLYAGMDASDANFSLTKDEAHPNMWKIWFFTDNDRKWYNYGLNYDGKTLAGADLDIDPASYDFSYVVPEGQNATMFAFVSLIGHDYKGNVVATEGNFIDDVRFELILPAIDETRDDRVVISAPTDTENYPAVQAKISGETATVRFMWQVSFVGEPTVENFGMYILPFDMFESKGMDGSIFVRRDASLSDGDVFQADVTDIPAAAFDRAVYAVAFVNGELCTTSYITTVNQADIDR